MLLESSPTAPPDHYAIKRIHANGYALMQLYEVVLDHSRLGEGRQRPRRQPIVLRELLQEVATELDHAVRKSGLRHTWTATGSRATIQSDRHMVKTILTNLISNAIKYTEQGSIDTTLTTTDSELTLVVRDTGVGVDDSVRAVMFEPFRQGDGGSTRLHGGAGLGLHIVTRLVSALQGEIQVESDAGHGATFCVRLPTGAPDSEPPAAGPRAPWTA
jgi:signal transduction histidine kinase